MVGVSHHPLFVLRVTKSLLDLGVKSVGVEISKYALSLEPPPYPSSMSFWKKLISNLSEKGIRIVFLTPNSLGRKLVQKMVSGKWGSREDRLEYRTLVEDTTTRFMEKAALKEKPEAMVVGAFHAALMRKDILIPKNRFMMIGGPKELQLKRFLQDVADVRRWQMGRRKIRAVRLEKIQKRKIGKTQKTKRKKRSK